MTKKTSWFLSVAAIVIVLMGGGYAALRHSRTQVHALINQSLQEAERLHYNDRLNAFSRNPHIYVDPALKAYLFAPVSSRKIKSYTLQTTERENHLPVQGQHPGRESPETAERIPAGRHTACQGGGSEPVVSGAARKKACQRNGGRVLFRQVGPHPHTGRHLTHALCL